MKLFQRWLAVACIGAGLSAPASANTIVTFSVDHVTFAAGATGIGSTFLMTGTFDFDQTANTLSSNFNLTFDDAFHTPLSPVWTTNSTIAFTDFTQQLFGFEDDSFFIGHPPDRISFSFLHAPNAPFIPGQIFSVGGQDSTFGNGLGTCGTLSDGTCGPDGDLTSADSTLVVTNVVSTTPVSVPGPVVGAGLPGLLAGFGAMLAWYRGLGWLTRRRRKHAAA